MSQGSNDFMFEDEAEMQFIEDNDEADDSQAVWRILVVDDDADVHLATEHALAGVDLLGRMPEFLHAYSAVEGLAILKNTPNIAVILLDVVMETQDAGLKLVDQIRHELKLTIPRIILRTGQPGYAPELDAIRKYDINDYKTKNDLTRNKLFTAVLTAIRAYDQMMRMEIYRQGLEQIVQGSSDLMVQTGLQAFSSGVIQQLSAVLGVDPEGVLCAQADLDHDCASNEYIVIAAAGRYQGLIQHQLDEIDDVQIRESLKLCFQKRSHLFEKHYAVLNFALRGNKQFAVYVKSRQLPSDIDRNLLEVFCKNVSICADNINLISHLKDSAYLDKLVGLPNRAAFIDAIDNCINNNLFSEYSVVLIDVDRFAEINNAFGHSYGDELLVECAKRLEESFGIDSLIARLSGDAFGMLGKSATLIPAQIRAAIQRPFAIGDTVEHSVSFSMGIVRLKDSHGKGQAVLKDANIARKLSKQAGSGSEVFYAPEMSSDAKERTHLLQHLHGAFGNGRLHPAFQPQVDLLTGKLLGFEALMRWRNEQNELIPPDKFIPLAEQSGLIIGMGTWILRDSLHFIRQLELEGWHDLTMSVNVSAVQFRKTDFLDILQAALHDTQANPKMLELEITESVAMMGQNLVETTLRKIRAMGIAIAIDDFGTGFSSLSYLDRLPLDRLKIDRSFVTSICENADSGRITDMIIQLGRSLGLRVIAEGVEHQEQAERLLAMGCSEAQGYFYARPMPAAELKTWLLDWKIKHSL